jgi:type IV pilus assembly protein PilA
MLEILRKRRDEEGFTLIELMVVVLIIAILIAIAIPTFLGARARAQDRSAQSNIRNAFTAEKTYFTDAQAYTDNAAGALSAIEPSINWVNAVSAGSTAGNVAVKATPDGTSVCVNAHAASGNDFGLLDVASGANAGTWYKSGTIDCTANNVSTSGLKRTGW